jgi:hypothetical protein
MEMMCMDAITAILDVRRGAPSLLYGCVNLRVTHYCHSFDTLLTAY